MTGWKCKRCGEEKFKEKDLCKEHEWAGNIKNVEASSSTGAVTKKFNWSDELLETFTADAYYTERTALAKLMGITDMTHS